MFVNNQHGIQSQGQELDKFVFKGVHSKEVDKQISYNPGDHTVLWSKENHSIDKWR